MGSSAEVALHGAGVADCAGAVQPSWNHALDEDQRFVNLPGNDEELSLGEAGERRVNDVFRAHPQPPGNAVPIDTRDLVKLRIRESGTERLYRHGRTGGAQFEIKAFGEAVHPCLRGIIAVSSGRLA